MNGKTFRSDVQADYVELEPFAHKDVSGGGFRGSSGGDPAERIDTRVAGGEKVNTQRTPPKASSDHRHGEEHGGGGKEAFCRDGWPDRKPSIESQETDGGVVTRDGTGC